MKKSVFKTGGLFLAIGLFLIPEITNAQEIKTTRQEQREARKAELAEQYQVLDTLLSKRNFVLEADYLENKYGDRIFVPQLLNFIKVDSTDVVLQTGSNYYTGSNGVGGVTAEGKVSRWNLTKDPKNLSYFLSMTVLTNIGLYDISMWLSADNNARATIKGLWGGPLIYEGHLVAVDNSSVFKGQTRY